MDYLYCDRIVIGGWIDNYQNFDLSHRIYTSDVPVTISPLISHGNVGFDMNFKFFTIGPKAVSV